MVFHVHLLGLVPLVLYPDDYTSCQQQVSDVLYGFLILVTVWDQSCFKNDVL